MEVIDMEDIIERFQFKIFKYCYQMIRCKESAEDITQEAFIKFYQLSNGNKEYTPNYLYSIAHSKCIDYLRRQKIEYLFKKNYNKKIYTKSTEEEYFQNEFSYEIMTALNCLSSYEKSVLLLKSVNGLSYSEISKILNKKEATLRKQFQRVKSKIEKRINNKGVIMKNEKITII